MVLEVTFFFSIIGFDCCCWSPNLNYPWTHAEMPWLSSSPALVFVIVFLKTKKHIVSFWRCESSCISASFWPNAKCAERRLRDLKNLENPSASQGGPKTFLKPVWIHGQFCAIDHQDQLMMDPFVEPSRHESVKCSPQTPQTVVPPQGGYQGSC